MYLYYYVTVVLRVRNNWTYTMIDDNGGGGGGGIMGVYSRPNCLHFLIKHVLVVILS